MSEEEIHEEIAAEAAPVAPEDDDAASRKEAEEQARKYGWRPKEEFDRDPEGWVDADRFLELGSTQRKMRRDDKREYERQIGETKREFEARLARIEAVSKAATQRALEAQKAQHEAQLADIARQRREAAETADIARYDQLGQEEQKIRKAAPVADDVLEVKEQPKPDPYIDEYAKSDNGKWLAEPYLAKQGFEMIEAIPPQHRPAGAKAQLEYVEARFRQMYPAMFQTAQVKPAFNRVDGGGLAGGGPQRKGANSLPPEALRAGKDLVSEGIYKSLDEYAADYFAQE